MSTKVPMFIDSRAWCDTETLDAIIENMNAIRAKHNIPLIASAWIRAMEGVTDSQIDSEFREFLVTFSSVFATIVIRDLEERTEAVRRADEDDHGMTLNG